MLILRRRQTLRPLAQQHSRLASTSEPPKPKARIASSFGGINIPSRKDTPGKSLPNVDGFKPAAAAATTSAVNRPVPPQPVLVQPVVQDAGIAQKRLERLEELGKNAAVNNPPRPKKAPPPAFPDFAAQDKAFAQKRREAIEQMKFAAAQPILQRDVARPPPPAPFPATGRTIHPQPRTPTGTLPLRPNAPFVPQQQQRPPPAQLGQPDANYFRNSSVPATSVPPPPPGPRPALNNEPVFPGRVSTVYLGRTYNEQGDTGGGLEMANPPPMNVHRGGAPQFNANRGGFNGAANPMSSRGGFNNATHPMNPRGGFNGATNPMNPRGGFNGDVNPMNPRGGFNGAANSMSPRGGFNGAANPMSPRGGFNNNMNPNNYAPPGGMNNNRPAFNPLSPRAPGMAMSNNSRGRGTRGRGRGRRKPRRQNNETAASRKLFTNDDAEDVIDEDIPDILSTTVDMRSMARPFGTPAYIPPTHEGLSVTERAFASGEKRKPVFALPASKIKEKFAGDYSRYNRRNTSKLAQKRKLVPTEVALVNLARMRDVTPKLKLRAVGQVKQLARPQAKPSSSSHLLPKPTLSDPAPMATT